MDLPSNSVSPSQGQIGEYLLEKALFLTKYPREFLIRCPMCMVKHFILEGISRNTKPSLILLKGIW